MQDNHAALEFATKIAREAQKMIVDYFYSSDRTDVGLKADKTQVTEADDKINQILIDKVKVEFPEHGVLGEEQSYEPSRRELWVCDPIDGTSALIDGVPVALFSLAYVVDGRPVAAVLLDPFQNVLLTATKGGGAYANGRPIRVTSKDTIKDAKIGGSGTYKEVAGRRVVYDYLLDQGAKPLLVSGCAFKSGLVAQGRIDGQIFPGRSAHDVAAAALIVTEAGGRVTDVDGNDQLYDRPIRGAIISNGRLHNELVEAVAVLGADRFLGY